LIYVLFTFLIGKMVYTHFLSVKYTFYPLMIFIPKRPSKRMSLQGCLINIVYAYCFVDFDEKNMTLYPSFMLRTNLDRLLSIMFLISLSFDFDKHDV